MKKVYSKVAFKRKNFARNQMKKYRLKQDHMIYNANSWPTVHLFHEGLKVFLTSIKLISIFYRVTTQHYHHGLWFTNICGDLQPDLYC